MEYIKIAVLVKVNSEANDFYVRANSTFFFFVSHIKGNERLYPHWEITNRKKSKHKKYIVTNITKTLNEREREREREKKKKRERERERKRN